MMKVRVAVMLVIAGVALSKSGYADSVHHSALVSSAPGDCSTMSSENQQYAQQLNLQNQALFCSQFSDAQRASALQLSQPDANGSRMMPDDAVQKVAKDNNILTPATQKTPQKTPKGCPVK